MSEPMLQGRDRRFSRHAAPALAEGPGDVAAHQGVRVIEAR